MKIRLRTIVVGVLLFLLLIFVGLNWAAVTAVGQINLLFGTVAAPLGVVLLAVIAVLTVIYLVTLARIEAAAALESRRVLKELEKARALAERAEVSRIDGLREFLEQELGEIKQLQSEALAQSEAAAVQLAEGVLSETEKMAERIDRMESGDQDPGEG